MEPLAVLAQLDYDLFAIRSDETGLLCEDVSLAKQSFREESDINTIVKRFRISGELPTGVRMPTYGDFTGVFDFHSAMNAVALANEAFDDMPADIRLRFHNDPQEFVAFCSDEANLDEARKLGLVPAAEVVKAAAVVVEKPAVVVAADKPPVVEAKPVAQ
jgi:phage internal scaffolding protein